MEKVPFNRGFMEQLATLQSKSDSELQEQLSCLENSVKNLKTTKKNQKLIVHLKREQFLYQTEIGRRVGRVRVQG